jgi:hypothetical protein
MLLVSRPLNDGRSITPVFSSMRVVVGFLEQAERTGHKVGLDYVFPLSSARFQDDLRAYTPLLDPSPAAFYAAGVEPRT